MKIFEVGGMQCGMAPTATSVPCLAGKVAGGHTQDLFVLSHPVKSTNIHHGCSDVSVIFMHSALKQSKIRIKIRDGISAAVPSCHKQLFDFTCV